MTIPHARLFSAIFCLLTFGCSQPVRAQAPIPPVAQQPTTQAPPTTPPLTEAPTPPTSYAHHYLDQNIQLTELNKDFYATRRELGFTFADGISDKTITTSVKFDIDQDTLTKFLTALAPRVNSPAIPAHPVLVTPFVHETALKSDNVVRPAKIVPAQPAVTLVIPDSVAAISSAVASDPLVFSIPLTINTAAAPPDAHNLVGIDSRIAHFVTHFDTAEVGRTQTVRRAIELIDGTVLQPGQIFSINQTVGERTIARGFGIGKVFINGTMKDQVGGGMCQVATTLFNAALLANLNIIERHQHVRTVPYVPAGGDATVYFGQKDFQFQNNTQTPIYIYYKTYGHFAVCDLYGKGDPSTKVVVITTPTQLGQRYFKGVITRYVTADGKTKVTFVAHSTYKWTPSLDYLR